MSVRRGIAGARDPAWPTLSTSRRAAASWPTRTPAPWDPAFQHGGPVAALMARAVESELGHGFHVARLTVDFLRPVPIAALQPAPSAPATGGA